MSQFDTYVFIKNLEKSGLSEGQAKAICDGLKDCHEASDHVTKSDFLSFKSDIKTEMAEFKSEIRSDMAEFKAEIKSEMAEFKTEIKSEMSEFKTSIKADMDCLESRLDKKISDTAHHQTRVIGAMVVGAITLLTLFDRYIPTNMANLSQYLWS
ncbi:MAG: hypothetical protein RIQ84_931 [Pseudomonadota bacterium]